MQVINTQTIHYIKDNKKQKIFTTAENLQKAIKQFFNWYNTTTQQTKNKYIKKRGKQNGNTQQKHEKSKTIYK